MLREFLNQALLSLGYQVTCAKDGIEAVEIIQNSETAYDAIILDLTVPGSMGGKEAIEIIKKIDPNVKAIVSSGYNHDPVMANYKEYGFNGLITKPYNVEELNQTLMEVFVE